MSQQESKIWTIFTWFARSVDVGAGLIVDPVEARLHGQPGQESVLSAVPVWGGDVNGAAFVVKGLFCVVEVFVPGFRDTESDPGPLVHHGDGQSVQFLLASLKYKTDLFK